MNSSHIWQFVTLYLRCSSHKSTNSFMQRVISETDWLFLSRFSKSCFYWCRRSVTLSRNASHLARSWLTWTYATPWRVVCLRFMFTIYLFISWSLGSTFSTKFLDHLKLFLACCLLNPSYRPSYDHPNETRKEREQLWRFFIVQPSPFFYYCRPVMSKRSPLLLVKSVQL